MGRRIYALLTPVEEQGLMAELRHDNYIVVPHRPDGPDLLQAAWDELPTVTQANPWDRSGVVLPKLLAVRRRARYVAPAPASNTGPRGSGPPPPPYAVDGSHFPGIEWRRDPPAEPSIRPGSAYADELYVNTDVNEEDRHWLGKVIEEYEKLVKMIKTWTIRHPGGAYWSKTLPRERPRGVKDAARI